MTAADFAMGFVLMPLAAGLITVAELLKEDCAMGPKIKTRVMSIAEQLRAAGWQIEARPNKGEPVWIKRQTGQVVARMVESLAVATLAKLQPGEVMAESRLAEKHF